MWCKRQEKWLRSYVYYTKRTAKASPSSWYDSPLWPKTLNYPAECPDMWPFRISKSRKKGSSVLFYMHHHLYTKAGSHEWSVTYILIGNHQQRLDNHHNAITNKNALNFSNQEKCIYKETSLWYKVIKKELNFESICWYQVNVFA